MHKNVAEKYNFVINISLTSPQYFQSNDSSSSSIFFGGDPNFNMLRKFP